MSGRNIGDAQNPSICVPSFTLIYFCYEEVNILRMFVINVIYIYIYIYHQQYERVALLQLTVKTNADKFKRYTSARAFS